MDLENRAAHRERPLVPAPRPRRAGDLERRALIETGIIVLLLRSGSLILALQACTRSESDAALADGVPFRLAAAYLMWLLTLAAVLLQVMLPATPARLVATHAGLTISAAVWLMDFRANEVLFSAGAGAAAWRSPGFCFGRTLMTLALLRLLIVL